MRAWMKNFGIGLAKKEKKRKLSLGFSDKNS